MGFFDIDNTNKNKTRITPETILESPVFEPVGTWTEHEYSENEVYAIDRNKCENNTKNNLVATGLREYSEAGAAPLEDVAPDRLSPTCATCQHVYVDAASFSCDTAYHCSRSMGKSIMEDVIGVTCCNMYTAALSSTLQQRRG